MTPLYQTVITRVGPYAYDALAENMLILFDETVPQDAGDYCFIHAADTLKGDIHPGAGLAIDTDRYTVTAVGDVVGKNLAQLGHITIVFDGQPTAKNPGSLHVLGPIPDSLQVGSTISITARP
jgi:PTS system glucitol/sorbitol-specific IIA component